MKPFKMNVKTGVRYFPDNHPYYLFTLEQLNETFNLEQLNQTHHYSDIFMLAPSPSELPLPPINWLTY